MQDYQYEFIEFARGLNVLRFGEFTLKSGRISPYFFNAGLFHSGKALAQLGEFYAQAILKSGQSFDLLFGPAYKGIPLATATAIALQKHGVDIEVSFNRKEIKDHGEGGQLIGAPLAGKILMIDDVITAGTAFRESYDLIKANDAKINGVLIALDRQEKGLGETSAIQDIEREHQIPVLSIIKLEHLIAYLKEKNESEHLDKIQAYRKQYGI